MSENRRLRIVAVACGVLFAMVAGGCGGENGGEPTGEPGEVAVDLNGLAHSDVVVELIIGRPIDEPRARQGARYELEWEGAKNELGEDLFALRLAPELCGKLQYRIRVYPCHDLLTHPFETGLMIWL